MRCTGKHVDHGVALELIASVAEQLGIAPKRSGVAAHQDKYGRLGAHERLNRSLAQSFARWIGDDNPRRRRTPASNVCLDNLGVCVNQIHASVGDRIATTLDGVYGAIRPDRASEDPNPGVSVNKRAIGPVLVDHLLHLSDERINTGGSVLEERTSRDTPRSACRLFVDPRSLAGHELCVGDDGYIIGQLDTEVGTCDHDKTFARAVADSDLDLFGISESTVDEQLLGQRVDGAALIGDDNVVGGTNAIAGPAVEHGSSHRGTSMIVIKISQARWGRIDLSAHELVDDHRLLHADGSAGLDMQEVTTAASLKLVRAADRNPIRRWVDDENDAAS